MRVSGSSHSHLLARESGDVPEGQPPKGQGSICAIDEDPLSHWHQGDFALEVGGFLYASTPQSSEAYDVSEDATGVCGLIAISQSCDIVRETGGRHYVSFCPLVEVESDLASDIKKGRRPYFAHVENAEETVFADLRRIMSVEKQLVRTWKRHSGFRSEEARVRFAAALERKFGQFAFPDEFDGAIRRFRQRVWSRHSKQDSGPGKVYRSLEQIRFRADPNWAADERKISVVAVMQGSKPPKATRQEISKELEQEIEKIKWPAGYKWSTPRPLLGTAGDLTAEDILTSRNGDFEFLCS